MISYVVDSIRRAIVKQHDVRSDVWFWLLKVVLMVHTVAGIREYFCPGTCIDLTEYGEIWLASILMFLFTYVPFAFYARYLYYHSIAGLPEVDPTKIRLEGVGKEYLEVYKDDLFYVQAADNYVDVFHLDRQSNNADLKKETMRQTLGALEDQLSSYPQFLRIHRSMLINLNHTLKPVRKGVVTLHKNDHSIELPVSKSYQEKLEQFFVHPK